MSKLHESITQCSVFLTKKKLSILAKDSLKIEIELFPQCAISHESQSFSQLLCPCLQVVTMSLRNRLAQSGNSTQCKITFKTAVEQEVQYIISSPREIIFHCDNWCMVFKRDPPPYKSYTKQGTSATSTQLLYGARFRTAHKTIRSRAPYSKRAIIKVIWKCTIIMAPTKLKSNKEQNEHSE